MVNLKPETPPPQGTYPVLVAREVVYRAPHVSRHEAGEEGVVTSAGDRFVFVRFGNDTHAKACPPESLELVFQEENR